MRVGRIVGILLLVIGVILLGFAYHASQAPAERLADTFTGHFSDRTMWYALLGAAAGVSGILLAGFGIRK